jgi:hypothetical protein
MASFNTRQQVFRSTSIPQVMKDVLPLEGLQVLSFLLPIGVVVAVIEVADRLCGSSVEVAFAEGIECCVDCHCRIP